MLLVLLSVGYVFGDTIVYNHYPPTLLFSEQKSNPTIKVLDNVNYQGITMNYLISKKPWGLFIQIPCHDVIEAKYTDGSLIQYNCEEDTYDLAKLDLYTRNEIVPNSYFPRNARFNVSIGFSGDRVFGSIFSLSYDLSQSSTDELYLAYGQILGGWIRLASLGWKHYFRTIKSKKDFSVSKASFYSIASIQYFWMGRFQIGVGNTTIVDVPAGGKFVPLVAIGYEFGTINPIQIGFNYVIGAPKPLFPYIKMDIPIRKSS